MKMRITMIHTIITKSTIINIVFAFALFTGLSSCTQQKEPLPYFGKEEVLLQDENGEDYIDTVYKQITGFNFIDQDSNRVTEETVAGKVYVVDFFFTSCPTICPKMKQQMLRIYEKYEENDNVVLLSHSIDIRNDTVPKLKRYADKLEIDSKKWHMVTGTKNGIYGIAEDYILPAQEDDAAPGGYLHSGQFVLMDGDHHIRGYYDGTVPTDVDLLMKHMDWLLEEQKKSNQ